MKPLIPPLLLLTACAPGTWQVTTWGEDYIEAGIPASAFEDGCEARFDAFAVGVAEAALLDGDGEVVAAVEPLDVELTAPGPHPLGSADLPRGTFARARFVIGPVSGAAVRAAGSLRCGEDEVSFDWSFDEATTYDCDLDPLTVAPGGEGTTELTVHGDHLFYDHLEDPDAVLLGSHLVAADSDGDGALDLDELGAVDLAPTGLGVGRYAEVTDLAGFVAHLVRTLGHVNGEGHCGVSFE